MVRKGEGWRGRVCVRGGVGGGGGGVEKEREKEEEEENRGSERKAIVGSANPKKSKWLSQT